MIVWSTDKQTIGWQHQSCDCGADRYSLGRQERIVEGVRRHRNDAEKRRNGK